MQLRDRVKELRRVKASELLSHPKNWRRHPQAQRDALRTMLDRVGYVDAVIARETPGGLMLIDGHLRTGLTPDAEIPVLVVDLDESEADEVLATLDPLAAMAEPDTERLRALVDGLATKTNEAMTDLLDRMHGLSKPDMPDEQPLTEEPEPRAKRGQVWQLGRHLLMCGDSTSAEDVARLLDGAKPRLMVTDPPYGVDYDASWRNEDLAYAPARVGQITNDDTFDWAPTLQTYQPDVLYVWSPPCDHMLHFGRIIQDAGYEIRSQLIWRKQKLVLSRGHYHWRHEPCWYAVRKGATAHWVGDRSQSTVWDVSWDKNVGMETGGHSTQKPLECMERPIRNHEGDVYDPFVGSGTTIIAAERQGRACYAMEIEPRYVDMAIARWEQYTGGKAEVINGQVGQ